MRASTRIFHLTVIRLLKGCLKAWETWLHKQPVVNDVVDAPDSTSSKP